MQVRAPTGTGPGTITADGCAVELYAQLPAFGEPEIMHGAVPAGASVLDLGCGTGRILRPLTALGHPVLGVDESPEMLARCADLATLCASIEGLRLDRRFDAVLMASNLLNTPDRRQRVQWLAVAARHLAGPAGQVVIQQHPPSWFDRVTNTRQAKGGITFGLRDVVRSGPLVSATAEYRIGTQVWTHSFTTYRLSEDELHRDLRAAGLRFDRWLTDDRGWLAARLASPPD